MNSVNSDLKEKLTDNKNNLIGCYDPLAFEKFNSLFRFHFIKQINDFDINKTNVDK